VDWAKYSDKRSNEFDKIAGGDQLTPIRLQTTGVCFYQTPFVKKTANYKSAGLGTAYRTYLGGAEAARGYWLAVPGDTGMDGGDFHDIECFVEKNAARSSFDVVGTIGAWAGYIFHQTITGRPIIGLDTQPVRFADSIPAIQ
jgi:hypothetical protein